MKRKTILSLPLAALAIFVTPAEAGTPSCRPTVQVQFQYNTCRPTYVSTRVVSTRTECRWATDRCGRRYSYEVTVVTYADVYSDGSQRRYTRVG
jgi:hypothetical protein